MALECDVKSKEERIKCARENNCDHRSCVGNITLKSGNETVEESVSELIKRIDSDGNCEEHMKYEYGEQWDVIDVDARNIFTYCTPSLIKCIAGVNLYRERIKTIDRSNKTVE